MIRDKLEIYRDYSEVSKGCLVCNRGDHILMQCNHVFYLPNRDFLIRKYNFSPFQTRNPKTRGKRKSKRFPTLMRLSSLKVSRNKLISAYDLYSDIEIPLDEDGEPSIDLDCSLNMSLNRVGIFLIFFF